MKETIKDTENMILSFCLKLKGYIKLRESVLVHLIFLF